MVPLSTRSSRLKSCCYGYRRKRERGPITTIPPWALPPSSRRQVAMKIGMGRVLVDSPKLELDMSNMGDCWACHSNEWNGSMKNITENARLPVCWLNCGQCLFVAADDGWLGWHIHKFCHLRYTYHVTVGGHYHCAVAQFVLEPVHNSYARWTNSV